MYDNKIMLKGEITIIKTNIKTNIETIVYKNKLNIVTYANVLIDMLLNGDDNFNTNSLIITNFAWGDNTTPATEDDTTIDNLAGSPKAITKKELSGNGVRTTGIIAVADYVGQIDEIGFLAQDGTLLNRINVDIFKTALESITIVWQHTLIAT